MNIKELDRACEVKGCGLSAWACSRLQDIVYENDVAVRRKVASAVREDMHEFIQAYATEVAIKELEKLIKKRRITSSEDWFDDVLDIDDLTDRINALKRKDEDSQ